MNRILVCVLSIGLLMFGSCQQEDQKRPLDDLTQVEKNAILKLGFSPQNVQRVDDGFLVEGDIYIPKADLGITPEMQFLRIANEEQYRTFNLVTSLPRVITISISDRLPSSYVACLDIAIGRYNAENLQITMQRVSSGADINIVKGNGNYLASAGFPTSSGDPYGQVKINSNYIGNNPNQNYLATIIAHELGHCVGFRHTDYMNRAYSCGGQPVNEGAGSVGAVHIPGTPTGPDANSWMLSCIGSGQNRPFNANDKTALDYIY